MKSNSFFRWLIAIMVALIAAMIAMGCCGRRGSDNIEHEHEQAGIPKSVAENTPTADSGAWSRQWELCAEVCRQVALNLESAHDAAVAALQHAGKMRDGLSSTPAPANSPAISPAAPTAISPAAPTVAGSADATIKRSEAGLSELPPQK